MILITYVLYVLLDVINLEILNSFCVSEQHEQIKLQVRLGCCYVSTGKQLQTIRRRVLPSYLGSRNQRKESFLTPKTEALRILDTSERYLLVGADK